MTPTASATISDGGDDQPPRRLPWLTRGRAAGAAACRAAALAEPCWRRALPAARATVAGFVGLVIECAFLVAVRGAAHGGPLLSRASLGPHLWTGAVGRAGPRTARPAAGGRKRGAAQYDGPVTPEELSSVLRTAVARPSRRVAGRRRSPTRSSSSAPRTASTATTPPTSRCSWPSRPAARRARSPSCSPSALREVAGHRRGRHRRPRLPQHHAGAAGALGAAGPHVVVEAGRGLRPHRRAGRAADQPRVRLGQPDRPGAHRRRPLGRGRRRAGPAAASASGAEVTREYYFNDAGAQIDRFAASLLAARAAASRCPEDGYAGAYIAEIAAPGRRRATRTCSTLPRATRRRRCSGREGVELMFAEIKRSRCTTSASTSTSTSHENDAARLAARSSARWRRLREQGHVFEADGAVWLRTTDFGDDKDRVLIKQRRRADLLRRRLRLLPRQARARLRPGASIMLGADHHGYVGRLQGDGRLLSATTRTRTSRSSSASWSTWCATASRCG